MRIDINLLPRPRRVVIDALGEIGVLFLCILLLFCALTWAFVVVRLAWTLSGKV